MCGSSIAAQPYYIESVSLNIYSLEELCYYIENDTDRLDEGFFEEELYAWIEQELDCGSLAEGLRALADRKEPMASSVRLIMEESAYFEDEQKQEILRQLIELEGKEGFEKSRLRADRLLKNGRYAKSILEYQRLLEEDALSAEDIGNIRHNMGVASAGMFLYDHAAEYFKKAYDYNNNPESLRQMHYALQCMEELKETDGEAFVSPDETAAIPKGEERLEEWKKKYRVYSRL